MNLTINQAIAFKNQFQKRITDLTYLRTQSISQTSYFNDEGKKIRETENQYDIKALDKKITELQNWMFKLDAEIKAVNAKTELSLDVPVDDLMAPIQ